MNNVKLKVLMVFAAVLLLSGSVSGTVIDDFEDGDVSDWSTIHGVSSQFYTSSNSPISGVYSGVIEGFDEDYRGIKEIDVINNLDSKVNISFKYQTVSTSQTSSNCDDASLALLNDNSERVSIINFHRQDGGGSSTDCEIIHNGVETGKVVNDFFNSPSNVYRIDLVFFPSNKTSSLSLIDLSNGELELSHSAPIERNDSIFKVQVDIQRGAAPGLKYKIDDIIKANNLIEPVFNSVSTEPVNWTFNSSINISANVSDDSDVSSVSADVWEDGSKIKDNVALSEESSGNWTVDNLFTVDEDEVSYNISLTATDDDGAGTTYNMSQFIENSAPGFSITIPDNQTYWRHDVDYKVISNDDGDDIPNESVECSLYDDGVFLKNGSGKEEDFELTGTLDKAVGSHGFTAQCEDGEKINKSVNYSVDNFKILSVSSDNSSLETEEETYSYEFKVADFVDFVEADLVWNGSVKDSDTAYSYMEDRFTTFSTGNKSNSQSFELPLVQQNNSEFNYSISFDVNYSDVSGSSVISTESSDEQNQSVNWAYFADSFNIAQDKIVEAQNITAVMDIYSDLPDFKAVSEPKIEYNGSVKSGSSADFVTPVLNGTLSSDTHGYGWTMLSFKDSSRNVSAGSDIVTVHDKRLTDCTDGSASQTEAVKFLLRNEDNRSEKINGQINYNFDVTKLGRDVENFAFQRSGKEVSTCIYPSWAEYNISGPIQYEKDGYHDRSYVLGEQIEISNDTSLFNLYLAPDTISTPIYYKVIRNDGSAVSGATIKVMRYFTGENSYITVAKSETDSEGIATTFVEVNDIYYKYIISKDGKVLRETDRQILTCQSSPCQKTFVVDPDAGSEYFSYKEGFSHDCYQTKESEGNVSLQCTVSHESGTMEKAVLKVEESVALGWNTVCENEVVSTGTSMVCTLPNLTENTVRYSLIAEKDGYQYTLETGSLGVSNETYPSDTYLMAFIVFITIVGLGITTPASTILFGVLGMMVTYWFNLYAVSVSALIGIIIVGIISLLEVKV